VSGNLAQLREGDTIEIDANQGKLQLKVSEAELHERRAACRSAHAVVVDSLLEKYVQSVRSASIDTVTHSGAMRCPEDTLDVG
jgi:dihydroxy-acid dehydratase